MSLEARVAATLDRLHPGGALGIALSGGGDSLALLLLAADWARARGVRLEAATVDHGLRLGSAAEAETAARAARATGATAAILRWQGWDGSGNLQAEARTARTGLLADWAASRGLAAVALGHTLDDQAETVLMRLARGSGVDGLGAMAEAARREGALWLRPLLGERRADLRAFLSARGAVWAEDPSNDDLRFDRVRARRALDLLAPLGIGAAGLAATAARMATARAALDAQTSALATAAARLGPLGDATLDRAALRAAPREIGLRLVARALRAVAGDDYPPRFAALAALVGAVTDESARGGRTLHGCVARWAGAQLVLAREPAAAEAGALLRGVWDGRFEVLAAGPGQVGALGEDGAAALAAARRAGRWTPPEAWRAAPRAARLSAPALRDGARLVAVPHACYGDGLRVRRLARVDLPGAAHM